MAPRGCKLVCPSAPSGSQLALQGDTEEKGTAAGGSSQGGVADMLQDSEYMKSLLGSLPGVDPSDAALQGALANLSKNEDFKGKGDEDKDEHKKDKK